MTDQTKACKHSKREITFDDLPLFCPTEDQAVWNAHPRVFLPIEDKGHAKCPYCGTEYILKNWKPSVQL